MVTSATDNIGASEVTLSNACEKSQMTNPYEPPKAPLKPSPRSDDFFVRAQKYQWRGFYAGLLLGILSMLVTANSGNELVSDVFDFLGALGAILLFLSIGSILPLAIWGFVKGYRESHRG